MMTPDFEYIAFQLHRNKLNRLKNETPNIVSLTCVLNSDKFNIQRLIIGKVYPAILCCLDWFPVFLPLYCWIRDTSHMTFQVQVLILVQHWYPFYSLYLWGNWEIFVNIVNLEMVHEIYEPHREKTGFLPRRKQRRRSASR